MKKLAIVFVLCLSHFLSNAQEVFDYFENNPEWYVFEHSGGNPFYDPDWTSMDRAYYINGDTILDGIFYHQLWSRGDGQSDSGSIPYGENLRYFVRQDSTKIFVRSTFNSSEELAVDYGYEVGDTIEETTYNALYENSIVLSIDSIEINGNQHRVFQLSTGDEMIEGIGSLGGLFIHPIGPIVNGSSSLKCYFQNEEFFYSPEGTETCDFSVGIYEKENINEVSIYPNPTNSKIQFDSDGEISQFTIYDLTGEVIYTENNLSSNFVLDIQSWTKGLYLTELLFEDGSVVRRQFVKN